MLQQQIEDINKKKPMEWTFYWVIPKDEHPISGTWEIKSTHQVIPIPCSVETFYGVDVWLDDNSLVVEINV